MFRTVLGSVLKEAAERVALEITAAKVAELSTNLESLRRGADLAISVTRKKIAAIEEAAKADREAINALAARIDLLADNPEIGSKERSEATTIGGYREAWADIGKLDCAIGQCRTNLDGDVIRLEAQAKDGGFVPVSVVGRAPLMPGWPMSAEVICEQWPIVLAAKVYAEPGPRVGFGG